MTALDKSHLILAASLMYPRSYLCIPSRTVTVEFLVSTVFVFGAPVDQKCLSCCQGGSKSKKLWHTVESNGKFYHQSGSSGSIASMLSFTKYCNLSPEKVVCAGPLHKHKILLFFKKITTKLT